MSRWLYWSFVIGALLLSGYCFTWAIQTAWLGSFPGRDVHIYTVRFYWQLFAAGAFFVLALFVAIKYRRRNPPPVASNDG